MSDRRLAVAMACLLVASAAGQSKAWDATGHRMISSMATEMLPADLPAFLRADGVPPMIGELSREPDRWRDSGTTHDRERNPGHWVNLDDRGRIDGGPTLAELPESREDYDTQVRAAGFSQYAAGYLPYSIVDGWQQLVKDFAYWRILVATADTASDPALAARAERDRALREMLILRDLGVWSHYVADAGNPMHTTIHSDGWGEYPNPNGYSTKKGLHIDIERDFVLANIEPEDVRQAVPAPISCACGIMDRVRTYIAASNAQVVPLYQLEKEGGFSGPDARGEDFIAARMGAGVAEVRDLVVMAWRASQAMPVGFPPVTLAEVLAGTDPTVALFGRRSAADAGP